VMVLIILLLFCLTVQPVQSQQVHSLAGYIYNLETNEPIVNAHIIVIDTPLGTSSGPDGFFELRLGAGEYRLKISSLGFSEKNMVFRIPGDNTEKLRIGLQPDYVQIENINIFGGFIIADRDSSINREPLSLLPAVTRLNAMDIQKQGAVTLTDAFKFVPGGWTETRGRKTKQFFSVRGQKYPYPDYSINGIWQKEFEETVYFLSALDIESIEIVRSSSALVKGLSGLTGIVDVKTKKPERETASLLAKYGEQNTYVTNLQYGNKINDISFNTSTVLFGTDGPAGLKGKERIANFHGNLDWKISRKLNLSTGSTYIHGLREFVNIIAPGASNILNVEEKFDPVRALLTYVKFNAMGDDGSLTEVQANVAYRNSDFSSFNIVNETTNSYQEKDYEYGFNVLHSRPLTHKNTLRIGGLYNHWVAPEGKRFYIGRRCNVHTWSGVVANEHRAGRFLFDAGFRLISGYIVEWGGFGIEGSAAGFQRVAPIENQTSPLEWQSVLGASYIMSNSQSFHYNFAGGTVAPRKGSLNGAGFTPENEVRFQHDLGFKFSSPNLSELTISTFIINRKNALELSGQTITTENDLVMELYENLDKRNYGVELSTKLNVPAVHSFLLANATLMKGENKISGSIVNDDKMPNIILNMGVLFDYSGFDANLYVNYIGPYKNNRFVNRLWTEEHGDFPLGDFVSVDITAGYTLSGKFSKRFFIEAKNIMDKKYLTVAGYPDPGRLLSTGVKVYF
jgi:hypothetical protein